MVSVAPAKQQQSRSLTPLAFGYAGIRDCVSWVFELICREVLAGSHRTVSHDLARLGRTLFPRSASCGLAHHELGIDDYFAAYCAVLFGIRHQAFIHDVADLFTRDVDRSERGRGKFSKTYIVKAGHGDIFGNA